MSEPSAIFRYEVLVDGGTHEIWCSAPLFVASRSHRDIVEFWACPDGPDAQLRRFTVVGTGHPLPAAAHVYRGTAIADGGALVWHLLEIT